MFLRWSKFNVTELIGEDYFIRNMATGAIVVLDAENYHYINDCISSCDLGVSEELLSLMGENGILVSKDEQEVKEFVDNFKLVREAKNDVFTLHLLTTFDCQMACSYCYEKDIDRKDYLGEKTFNKIVLWLTDYFNLYDIRLLKIVLYGGEPLLGMKEIRQALPILYSFAQERSVGFRLELVTNGELLTESRATFLSRYSWERVQITLDGYKDVHNKMRKNIFGEATFDTIIGNIQMLIVGDYIEKVDIRINFKVGIRESVIYLLNYLKDLGIKKRLNLSFGIIMPTFQSHKKISSKKIANDYIYFCKEVQKLGFDIPKEFTVGPWCVASERHSVVVQPNGELQKCISTVGRDFFNFSNIDNTPQSYAKDERFERFQRMDRCIEEMCSYIPVCGGGCKHDALVKYGHEGFNRRYCQRKLLSDINRGLLRLSVQ